jgi:hypothetical protein
MTQDQQIASSHWSMFGADGFPVHKGKRGWIISVETTSVFAPFGTYFPQVFKTKTAAQDFFNDLAMTRMREWRAADDAAMLQNVGLESPRIATRTEKFQQSELYTVRLVKPDGVTSIGSTYPSLQDAEAKAYRMHQSLCADNYFGAEVVIIESDGREYARYEVV